MEGVSSPSLEAFKQWLSNCLERKLDRRCLHLLGTELDDR